MINVRDLYHHNALVQFEVHTPEAMSALGKAFAGLLARDWSDISNPARIQQIGLVAMPHTGKTIFVNGLMGSFKDAIKFEDQTLITSPEKSYPQALWHTTEAGHIRHVDAAFYKNYPTRVLEPYRREYLEKNNIGGVDIIENAEQGVLTDKFDAALKFEKFLGNDQSRFRRVYLYATKEFQAKPGFAEFLNTAYRINRPAPAPENA